MARLTRMQVCSGDYRGVVKLQITNYKLQITRYKLQGTNYKVQITNYLYTSLQSYGDKKKVTV